MAARYGTDWRRLYAANRDVIGDDPDVIVPGQRLDI
ncbi:LysM peptidoglycan-binding domain-containing protein [Streptomyces sp. MMS20-AI2-20]|nr:LysM peptidoglycan-binding domain-containing protein [Streptomyces sp. MMS20-AI2-20]